MAFIARQSPLLRQSCLSAFRSPFVGRNAAGVSQVVAFHASAKKQILPPLPRKSFDYSIAMDPTVVAAVVYCVHVLTSCERNHPGNGYVFCLFDNTSTCDNQGRIDD